ncbi:MAG: ComEC/Rec2 family competence protein [Alphaproteobacteria bacterium]
MYKSQTSNLIAETLLEERNRFVLWLPVFLAIGIGWYFGMETEPDHKMLGYLALGTASLAVILRRTFWPRLVAVAVFAVCLGLFLAAKRTDTVAAPYLYSTIYFKEVTGRIDDIAMREADQKIYITDVSIEGVKPETTPHRISIALRKPNPELRIGDRIKAKAMLFPPPGPAMPGAFDFGRKFYFERLGGVGHTPHDIEVVEPVGVNNFEEWLNDLRLDIARRIQGNMAADTGAVASAIMVGEQDSISDEVRDSMRDSGLYHVLSISGLHMALAVGVIYATLRLLLSLYMPLALRLPTKKIAAAFGLAGAFCYLLLAGYPVPAVRSFVMVACVMLAVLFDRRGISVYSLCWAALVILLFQPESLVGASFQLSFAATLAIVTLYERYSHKLHPADAGWLRSLRIYFMGLMATSLVATLATTPLVIHLFGRMTIWGLATNMMMMPLASLWIMPFAVLSFLAMPFGLEAWPLAALELGIQWMLDTSRWFSSLPFASIVLPSMTHWGMLLVVFGGLWLCLWEKRWKLLGMPAIVIGLSTIALYQPYDVVVNDEGKRVLVRLDDGRYVFLRGRPDSFEGEHWLQTMGIKEALTPKDFKGKDDAPDCSKERCDLVLRNRHLVVSLRKDAQNLCAEQTHTVITERYLEKGECMDAAVAIDKRFLRANGATALRLQGNAVQVDVTATGRGARPWGKRAYWPLYQTDKPSMMQRKSEPEDAK